MAEPIEGSFSGNLFCYKSGIAVPHDKGVWAAIKNFFTSGTVGVCVQVDGKEHKIYISQGNYEQLVKAVFVSTGGNQTTLKTTTSIKKIFSSLYGKQEPPPSPRMILNPDLQIQGEYRDRLEGKEYTIPHINIILCWSPEELETEYKRVPKDQQVNFLAAVEAAVILEALEKGDILEEGPPTGTLLFRESHARRLGQTAALLLMHTTGNTLPPGFENAVNSYFDIETELGRKSRTLFSKTMDALFNSVRVSKTPAQETKPYAIPSIEIMKTWTKKDLLEEYKKVPENQQLAFLARVEAAVVLSAIQKGSDKFNEELKRMIETINKGKEPKPILFMDQHALALGNAAAVLLVQRAEKMREKDSALPAALLDFEDDKHNPVGATSYFTGSTQEKEEARVLFLRAMEKFLSFANVYSQLEKAAEDREMEARKQREKRK
jgi:hypothetical protein